MTPSRPGRPAPRPEVVHVTTARMSHTEDINLREKRYVRTQLVRVLCIGLGVLLPVAVPLRLGFFLLAVCLPWFGVVMANAGPTVSRQQKTAIVDGPVSGTLPEEPVRIAIEPGRTIDASV